ncbi:MAG TPA: HAMP domain-containing sensor histidine kinase [Gemmatirosa sp.]|nr:HAMP domain-containing sensor histidine kinase [Gemmatirosa sp.]
MTGSDVTERPLRLVRTEVDGSTPPQGPYGPPRPGEPEAYHPLTTHASPLLPARHASRGRADVWEELDRAAAWVCDQHDPDEPPGREGVRHALRVLAVALRGVVLDELPVRAQDLPWHAPVVELLGAIRRRLVAQSLAPSDGAAANPEDVLHLLGAIDRLEEAARADVARSTVDELSGARALELLVEVAHDMRSPLGSILFLVERLRGRPAITGDPQAQRALGLVYGAAFGLSSMVGDVMELARGGDRLAGGEPEPFSLATMAEDVAAIVAPIAEEKRLHFVLHPVSGGSRLGHPAAVQRVVLNLVTNALKFTPEGEVSLRIVSEGVARVGFEIRDTGPGIPARVQAQLFRAFRPRVGGDGTAFSSAGLGLAICRKLIARMGGELLVDSAEGRGTRFAFSLELPVAGPGGARLAAGGPDGLPSGQG